jgi:phospholipase C
MTKVRPAVVMSSLTRQPGDTCRAKDHEQLVTIDQQLEEDRMIRRWLSMAAASAAAVTGAAVLAGVGGEPSFAGAQAAGAPPGQLAVSTETPIKHLVVIFQENVSFDHYFGTYPHATNPTGEPAFHAVPGTSTVNGLTPALLHHNPNTANPQRLDRSQALTCDQDHDYTPEQQAFDHGLMDKFIQHTQVDACSAPAFGEPGLGMDYYDGNTVTALWNYAQHFALSDNSFGTVFGPSTPGALNLVSGQTHGATPRQLPDEVSNGTVFGDPDPTFDDCSSPGTVAMGGRNIGDLLSAKGVSWGWFEGGFRPTSRSADGEAVCDATHQNVAGVPVSDYSAHHEPFQYYASTANPHHLPPANVAEIGHDGRANHQYDLTDFTAALKSGHLPAVSFLKAARYQDGHAGYSDPLDEQHFLVNTINALQRSKDWSSTAVIIAYDDSDGWYDHQMSPILNSSQSALDALSGPGKCGNGTPLGGFMDRCGYGPRLPLLAISPYSRVNAVDSTLTDQTSILRFIEDNWLGARRIGDSSFDRYSGSLNGLLNFHKSAAKPLFLNPDTGQPVMRAQPHQ